MTVPSGATEGGVFAQSLQGSLAPLHARQCACLFEEANEHRVVCAVQDAGIEFLDACVEMVGVSVDG